jgi:hypothetical protein
LYARGKIAASEYAAAKRWCELCSECQGPRAPRTASLEVTNGSSVDPDTLTGIKEAKRHERATLNYLEARDALRLSGAIAERVVTSVCIAGELPAGITELNALRNGLRALSAQWHSRRKPRQPLVTPRNRGSLSARAPSAEWTIAEVHERGRSHSSPSVPPPTLAGECHVAAARKQNPKGRLPH